MMINQFKIESIFKMSGRNKICVFAQSVGEPDFKLSENATLGNVPVENWLDIPTENDEEGNPRTDLFAFMLKDNSDRYKLKIDDIVELIS